MRTSLLLIMLALVVAATDTRADTTIAMYGDSTMYGLTAYGGTTSQTSANEPNGLSYLLTNNGFPNTVINKGIPMETACDLANAASPVTTSWATEMATTPASIIVINDAINDATYMNNGYETVAQFTACYENLIATAQAYGKIVVLDGPNPVFNVGNADTDTLSSTLKSIASKHGLQFVDQYNLILAQTNAVPLGWVYLLSDGIHPAPTLYQIKAANTFYVVRALLAALANGQSKASLKGR